MDSIRWLVDVARRAGIRRMVVNGSFVTDLYEPNDVDCVLLVEDDFPQDDVAESELLSGLPFLELSLVGQVEFDFLVQSFFATDRRSREKGMVEIIL